MWKNIGDPNFRTTLLLPIIYFHFINPNYFLNFSVHAFDQTVAVNLLCHFKQKNTV